MTQEPGPPLRRRVGPTVALLFVLVLASGTRPASGQVELTITPMMVKGVAAAPVVIIEFSDYQ